MFFSFMEDHIEITKMVSEKNKQLFIINGFKFSFNAFLNGDVQRWAKRMCKLYKKFDITTHAIWIHHEKTLHATRTKYNLCTQFGCARKIQSLTLLCIEK